MNRITRLCPFNSATLSEAAAMVRSGMPIAIATETVYGLAADACNGRAIAEIYNAKGRPSFNPLIVHALNLEQLEAIAIFSDTARLLAHRFWPGPLTMILPLREDAPVSKLIMGGLKTIAVRVPAHPAIRELIKASNRLLAAPSANASGAMSPTRASHVMKSLGGRIPMILDSGPTAHGLESTIVEVQARALRLLRPGPIVANELTEACGLLVCLSSASDPIAAPGQLESHYAPMKPLRLNARRAEPGEWLIGFGSVEGNESLSLSGSVLEAASNLFELLHVADVAPGSSIAVAPIPETGLGVAIMDRLRRAAAPRPSRGVNV